MAPHPITLAWKIRWAEEPGRLQSIGSLWLSDFTFTFPFHELEKEMATHSSVLAWRIPGIGEPGGLPSMGSHRVGHNWSDLAVQFSSVRFSHSVVSNSLRPHESQHAEACPSPTPAVHSGSHPSSQWCHRGLEKWKLQKKKKKNDSTFQCLLFSSHEIMCLPKWYLAIYSIS